MSVTEDESQTLDAGWDEEPLESARASAGAVDEAEVDEAWDSLPPPVSSAPMSAVAPSVPPVTEEVDSGWDDVPEGAPAPAGKRRPHRERRAKAHALPVTQSQVLSPRPAEPSKKQQREHARKQRAQEAQVKQLRKVERKQRRATEAREEAAERARRAEADAAARRALSEARERARSARPAPAPKAARVSKVTPSGLPASDSKPARATKAKPAAVSSTPATAAKQGPRWGVIVTLAVLAALVAALLLNK